MIFIQLIFVLFGLIQAELIQQELSPLPESLVCLDCDDCDVFYVTTNIENIKVGDYVLAQDVETGEVSLKEVTDTFVRTSDHLRYLTTVDEEGDTQTIETTDAHPFWVVTDNPDLSRAASEVVTENGTVLYHENLGVTANGYWVEAKDLRVGDVFLGANGELSVLVAQERVSFADGVKVYNFTVDGNHNYFVIAQTAEYGQTSVLVHNADYSHLTDHPSVGAGKDFTATQKRKLIDANREQNNGALTSDKSGRTLTPAQKSQKGVTPSSNEVQIDHILPKSEGGSNSFSNAQILSRIENRLKSNKVE